MIRFEYPFLALLWAVLALALVVLHRYHRAWRLPALPYSYVSILPDQSHILRRRFIIVSALKITALVLLVAALMRPQRLDLSIPPPKPVVDIVLCLDTSLSMSALDFDPETRLDAAKKAAEDFIYKRPLDRLGLVVFGGRALTQCPLTLDHAALVEFLRSVPINATQTEGTAIGSALALAGAQLAKSQAKTKLIILLTDGCNNAGSLDPLTAARAAADLSIKIYTIGTATPGGGWVWVNDPFFGRRKAQMAQDLDEPTLKQVAGLTSGQYHRVNAKSDFKHIYDAIDKLEKTRVDVAALAQYQDLYMWFLYPAWILWVVVVLLEKWLWRQVP